MNSSPLLLVPLAAVALLSSQPSKARVAEPAEAADVAAILDRPEFRALTERMQQTAGLLDVPDQADHQDHRAHAQKHEQGLHTVHLSASEGYYSAARGLTSEDEWQHMFPHYAGKLTDAH